MSSTPEPPARGDDADPSAEDASAAPPPPERAGAEPGGAESAGHEPAADAQMADQTVGEPAAPEQAEPAAPTAPEPAAPAPGSPQGYAPAPPGYGPPPGSVPAQGYAPPPGWGQQPPGTAAYGAPGTYPGSGLPASAVPAGAQPPTGPKRPPLWAGLLSGVGLQIAGLVVMLMLLSVTFSLSGNGAVFIMLLPFIVLLVGPALLMISWRWRRFATGVLIISAATWLVIIGPCLGLAMGA
jgi:hypothetical protein